MRLIVVITLLFSVDVAGQTGSIDMGRLFTTPEQRRQMDQIRYAVESNPVELIEEDEHQSKKQQSGPSIKPIVVKGLIYGGNGRNAAWINGYNTLRGNIEQEYIEINTERITPDQVPVLLKHKNEVLNLKVGESYIPD